MVLQILRDKIEFKTSPVTDNKVCVTRSNWLGNENSMILPMEEAEFLHRVAMWKKTGMLIQEVFPEFNADDREFVLTGTTPEEFERMFGKEDE